MDPYGPVLSGGEALPALWKQCTDAFTPGDCPTSRSLLRSSPSYAQWCAAGWQFASLPSTSSLTRLFADLTDWLHEDADFQMAWPLPSTLHCLFDAVRDAEPALLSQRLVHLPVKRLKELRFVPPPKPPKVRSWLNKRRIRELLKARPALSVDARALADQGPGFEGAAEAKAALLAHTDDADELVSLLQRAADGAVAMEQAERALLQHVGFVSSC